MRSKAGSAISLLASLALGLFLMGATARAEVLTATVSMSPSNEVPPIAGLAASAGMQVSINVTRDANGAITGATARFLGSVAFPGSITVVGLHIHEGVAGANGPVRVDSRLTAANSVTFASGAGLIDLTSNTLTDVAMLTRLLTNPTGFYVNLHTSVNPAGALRAQIVKMEETTAATIAISPANEVPPIAGLNATGTATITINPVRRPTTGEITGATVAFSMSYDFGGDVTVVGLHIHEGASGANGPVVINTGITAANSLRLTSGKGSISIPVPLRTTNEIEAMKRLLLNPAAFYVNIHTSANPAGAMRGQMVPMATPPAIQQASAYLLPTANTNATVNLLITGIDLQSTLLINGVQATATPDLTTGIIALTVPSSLLASNGTLTVQARNSNGLLSKPLVLVVAGTTNSVAVTTTDAARFGALVAPDSIASSFGAGLATASLSATVFPPPMLLDGSSIYVNGIQAGLFFVSPQQINYQIPPGTAPGAASVVIVNKNGEVSRGTVNVAPTIPAIFTAKSDGTGAPGAVASANGATFNLLVGNSDGTANALDAGNYVALFGTGFRFASATTTMTLGGTAVTPSYVGPQGPLSSLDQINFQIPASLAGRGD
ncbi:MAG: CHRD domain-containing protein, partial [Blastocatellia bacterium]|nr:CHRD domain-containing protein [Blastocatellia bacterium]